MTLQMTFLAAAFGPFAAPLIRVHLSPGAADAAHAGEAPAAVAGATHTLTEAPSSWLQLLLPQQQQQQQHTAAAAAAGEGPVVLYPRQVLLNEMLPWVSKKFRV